MGSLAQTIKLWYVHICVASEQLVRNKTKLREMNGINIANLDKIGIEA